MYGFILSLVALICMVLVWMFAPEYRTEAIAVLGPLIAGGSYVAMRQEPPSKGPTVMVVLTLLLLLGGCTTTYTAPKGSLAVAPYGDFGLTATLYVDTKEVCQLNVKHSKLAIHKDTAIRICSVFPRCVWKK